jgi:lipopolysaccharide export LptBFGC system permease protein LptF
VGGVLLALSPVLKRGEFSALWAAGLSPRRIVWAPLFLSFFVGLLLWIVVDQLEPRLQPRSRIVRAALTGRVQGGRTWQNPVTKTHWMAERFLLASGQAPLIQDVKAAPPEGDPLLIVCADQLTHSATEGWILQGSVVAIFRQEDGRTTRIVSDRLPCTGILELPEKRSAFAELLVNQRSFDSLALIQRLATAHPSQARTFRAEMLGRLLKMLLPLACVMAAIPIFVRFENRQRLTLAAIQALAMSAVPAIILSIACVHLDRPGLPTIPVAIAAAVLAFVPGLILFWRWRI